MRSGAITRGLRGKKPPPQDKGKMSERGIWGIPMTLPKNLIIILFIKIQILGIVI